MQPTDLGPYDIGERLGKGGMGSVYRGTNRETGRVAAIKVLAPQLAQSDGFRERFEAEIESLKTLRHDAIVRLFGYGKDHGMLFYAMELVDGTSLDEQIKQGRRFNWRETIDIALQVCRALKHAHDHGVIHRDIKPANILVSEAGEVKLADFGIARLFGGNQLTVAGGVLGTADYMSPEQAEGEAVSEKCDQYSLGCVMYCLLAGRPPFRARSLPEMLQMQRFAEPEPVSRYAPATPEPVTAAVAQMLQKDPAQRFPNIMVLGRHLEAVSKALAKREEEAEALITPDIDYDPALARTRVEDSGSVDPSEKTGVDERQSVSLHVNDGAQDDSATIASMPVGGAPQTIGETSPDGELDSSSAHFTMVDTDASATQSPAATVVQTLPIAAALMLLLGGAVFGVWYASQPLSAGELYVKIERAAEAGQLAQVEGDITLFLTDFAEDQRAGEVRGWQQQLEINQRNRRFDLLARRGRDPSKLLPVERKYVAAIRTADTDPIAAMQTLSALVELYGELSTEEEDDTARIAQCIELARAKIAQLQSQTSSEVEQQKQQLAELIASIESLQESEPTSAKRKAEALIELYAGDDWAEEFVKRARAVVEAAAL